MLMLAHLQGQARPMLIRHGYDITIECPQPTPLICLLVIRDERRVDLKEQGVGRVVSASSDPDV